MVTVLNIETVPSRKSMQSVMRVRWRVTQNQWGQKIHGSSSLGMFQSGKK